MQRAHLPILAAVLLSVGCAAMQKQYDTTLDRAVTVANVDQQGYTEVAMDFFDCAAADVACDPSWGDQVANQLAMVLGRIGYQVYDRAQFQALLLSPPVPQTTVTAEAGPAGVSMSITAGPDGASASVNVNATAQFVVYESLPQETQLLIVEQAGVAGVVSGRINIGSTDDVTGWREVHLFIRLGDARTGQLVWQGEWRGNATDDADLGETISESINHLARALERKNPLGAPLAVAAAH